MDVAFFDSEIEYRFLRYRLGFKEGTILCSLKPGSTAGYIFYHAPFTKFILVLYGVVKKKHILTWNKVLPLGFRGRF